MRHLWILLWVLMTDDARTAPSRMDDDDYSRWGMLGARINQPKCNAIPKDMEICESSKYKMMRLPNSLGHEQVSEALKQSYAWLPLIKTECHYALPDFLCSLFAPVCLDRFEIIKPCRSFCLSIKQGCEPVMNNFNFTWPAMLNCDTFPPKQALCMPLPPRPAKPVKTSVQKATCRACKDANKKETIIAAYCRSQIAMKVKVRATTKSARGLRLEVMRRRKYFKNKSRRSPSSISRMRIEIDTKNCECARIKSSGRYLVLANVQGKVLRATMVVPFRRRKLEFKHALRMMRKRRVCERDGVMQAIKGYSRARKRRRRRKSKRRGSRRQRGERG